MHKIVIFVVATTGRLASVAAQNDNNGGGQSSSGSFNNTTLIGVVIGVFMLVILIGGLSILACKMTGKMPSATSGRRHGGKENDPESLGLELELDAPPLEAKDSYVTQPTEDSGPLSIPMAALDFGDEIKDTGKVD